MRLLPSTYVSGEAEGTNPVVSPSALVPRALTLKEVGKNKGRLVSLHLPFCQPVKKNSRNLLPPLHAGRDEGRSRGRSSVQLRVQLSTPRIPARLKKVFEIEKLETFFIRTESKRSIHDRCKKASVSFVKYADGELSGVWDGRNGENCEDRVRCSSRRGRF